LGVSEIKSGARKPEKESGAGYGTGAPAVNVNVIAARFCRLSSLEGATDAPA
jgi:hypothetical protein